MRRPAAGTGRAPLRVAANGRRRPPPLGSAPRIARIEGNVVAAPLTVATPLHAEAHRPQEDPAHRLRPHRHRPGLRVRLLRHPGVQGPPRGGLRGRAGQLQPGHHHDRPGDGRPHLHRADHLGGRREDHREGTARRPAAHARRADRPQHRDGPAPARRAGEVRRRDDRRQRRGHRQGRGPRRSSRQAMLKIGLDVPQSAASPTRSAEAHDIRRRRSACRASCGRASRMGGTGGGIAYNREEFIRARRPRARAVARSTRC